MHRNLLFHVCSVICVNRSFCNTIRTTSRKGEMCKIAHTNVRFNSSESFVDYESDNNVHVIDESRTYSCMKLTNKEEEVRNNEAFIDTTDHGQLEPNENDVLDLYEQLSEVSENDVKELEQEIDNDTERTMTLNSSNDVNGVDQDEYYVSGLERETRVNQLPEMDYQEDLCNVNKLHSANENFWWLRDKVLVNDIPRRLPPLRIPDKEGEVVEEMENTEKEKLGINDDKVLVKMEEEERETKGKQKADEKKQEEEEQLPICHPINKHSYLTQQDLLYLSYPTSPEVLIDFLFNENSAFSRTSSSVVSAAAATALNAKPHIFAENYNCVLVVFTANDLRIHDNYALAMASAFIQERLQNNNSETSVNTSIIGVCVIDYRTFAQPSRIGGFYRQGPEKAQYLLNSIAALRRKLESELHIPLLIRCGRPEEHIPRLSIELNALVVFMSTQYFPHERRVQELMVTRLQERR